MRTLDYISTAQTNLMRTKLRTFLTVSAFVIGTFTLGMTTAFSQGLRTYINTQIAAYGQPNLITVGIGSTTRQSSASGVPYYQTGRSTGSGRDATKSFSVNEQDLQTTLHTPGVQTAYLNYNAPAVEYIAYSSAPKYILGVQSAFPGISINLDAGHMPSSNETNGIVLPYPYIEALGAQNAADLIGKTATVHIVNTVTQQPKDFQVQITGILPDTAHTPGAYLAYQTFDAMSQFQTNGRNAYTQIVAFTASNATKATRTQIKNALQAKGYSVQTYDDILAGFSRPLNIVTYGLDGFAGIALLAATIGIVNTLLMAVLERTQEIGLLKALGMRRRGITFIYLVEAMSIGFWGGVVGVGLAMLLGFIANPILTRTVFKGAGHAHVLSYPLPYMAAIIGGAMIIGLLAGVLPALRAGKLDPIEALRRE